jgi:dUTP pyrophosphatase
MLLISGIIKMVPTYLQLILKAIWEPDCEPTRANPSDAGADLVSKDRILLYKGERELVKTGVRVEIPIGHVGLLFPRSSLSKKDIIMTNSVGVIDSDYRGEIMASLMYIGNESGMYIHKGDRIVQLVVIPIVLPIFKLVDNLTETTRGEGGFGSTGVS